MEIIFLIAILIISIFFSVCQFIFDREDQVYIQEQNQELFSAHSRYPKSKIIKTSLSGQLCFIVSTKKEKEFVLKVIYLDETKKNFSFVEWYPEQKVIDSLKKQL